MTGRNKWTNPSKPWAMLLALPVLLGNFSGANADRLWAGAAGEMWGKIVAVDNNFVTFQVNCSGEPKKYKWNKDQGFAISFAEGCKEVDLSPWGNPVDCRKTGRLFVAGTQKGGRGSNIDYISFENDVLTFGYKGQKWVVKEPRKDIMEVWIGCN
jgi:hypothetical protein